MKANSSDSHRRLVALFSGHVQGVGFRFTVLDLAEGFPALSGCVRNLPDGRVEMIAEGPPGALGELLAAVEERMRPCISSTEVRREPATGEFAGFNISR